MQYSTEGKQEVLSNISHGSAYQEYTKNGFLQGDNSISGIFNADCVQLYSSSGVKLWPICIAINEIPIKERFARENMILAGLWQGKGQPPYYHYICTLGEEISMLFHEGLEINFDQDPQHIETVYFEVILGSLDLPTKCKVLNMIQYNGFYGCSVCEETGERANQGKCSTQLYPYREVESIPTLRSTENTKRDAMRATAAKRVKGIIGPSRLASMPWFHYVDGMVPDYMHGCLLGVMKTLLYLWFSPSSSGKEYFIGNKINDANKIFFVIQTP
eukprot:Seg1810.6 transcript_id=Seg1810.6/GoldUCD/mRNA.D3Y31 product="hypothetical protein" protein_id=Seg1810.6/GoldUCD/D3Y31